MFMYTICLQTNMAKLYWRIKKNGKWTWTAAEVLDKIEHVDGQGVKRTEVYVHQLEEE